MREPTWVDITEPTLEWAIRGVMRQSAGYRRFLDSLQAERERRKLALPQFAVELKEPRIPEAL